jgi:NAD(P)H-hydrate repair Nnr-like enzyme with NAD(P)H-hydrate dehydratase domain
VTEYPDLVKSYRKAILTPNVAEFGRLYEKLVRTYCNYEKKVLTVMVNNSTNINKKNNLRFHEYSTLVM